MLIQGLQFIEDNPEYVKTTNIRMKYLFHRYLSCKISANLSASARENPDTSVYLTEQENRLCELEDVFRFKGKYYNYKGCRDKTEREHNLTNICYLPIDSSKEHPLLTFLPLLKFRRLGYCTMLGTSVTKLGQNDFGVDGIAYMSDTVRLVQAQIGTSGFFLEELSLIRKYPQEFDDKRCNPSFDDEIILFEAEIGRKQVLSTCHGIRQIEEKLAAGIANKGYVTYDDFCEEAISESEIFDRHRDKNLIGTIGLINLHGPTEREPSIRANIIDERVRKDLDYWLQYYLLCNFTLPELIEIAGGAKENIEELNKCLNRIKVQDVLGELKKALEKEHHIAQPGTEGDLT